ncbi:Sulfotransferase family protein [Marininema mesophilum]|uniref:Sulfotransferase family protein n=1 Tax=Marininema mesophilum TaxID=1048340 RepID=A0A1H2WHW7_9BACL|nr:sulfotransferase family 2 domain-containing protein [Marininema mesophilum]SDW80135.1 Sulfotransferase family protein [Marininema mesophilum]
MREQIVQRLLSIPPLFHPSFPFILFWSPKSGCTSLTKWFFFQIKYPYDSSWVHIDREKYTYENNYLPKIKENMINGNKQAFKLVRDPYRRAVSSFIHAIKYSEHPSIHLKINLPKNKMAFLPYLYWVRETLHKKGSINEHIDPQYIEGEEHFINNHLYLENIESEIRSLENTFGLVSAPLHSLFTSNHHESNRMILGGNFANTLFTRECILNKGKELPRIESFYDQETRQLVREIFEKDFSHYKYEL